MLDITENFGLLLIGIAVIAPGILGVIVFSSDRKNITNRSFFALSLFTICWGVLNYLGNQYSSPEIVIWFIRFAIFFAVWNSLSLFQLAYVFPKKERVFPRWYKFVLLPAVTIVAVLTLTPLVFSSVAEFYPNGQVSKINNGPAIPIFGITIIGLVFGGFFLLIRKMLRSAGAEKKQSRLMAIGMIISFTLIVVFNMVLPAFLNDARFVSFSSLFLLPFIIAIFYAITKHHLFNVKVIATEMLVFAVWIVEIFELLNTNTVIEKTFVVFILSLLVIFGILLIKSVRKEVSEKEKFELLTKELSVANEKLKELDDLKTDFISIASHQLRTPLTAIKGYSSMILEGTYGAVPIKIKGATDKIFQSAQRLIYIVNDLLDISRIEQGRFTLTFEDVKVANVLKDVVEELKANIANKSLDLSFNVSVEDAEIKVKADFSKIRQVFSNILDNSIKYTPEGYVKVSLESRGDNALISVKDSGIGISESTIGNLFQKFSRAKGIAKMHTDGSGLGLYVAKEIIKAHNGRVWAESSGEGKGAQFYIELPKAE